MECKTAQGLLGNYIDEDLIDGVRAAVDQHVTICKSCRADLQSLQRSIAKLGSASPLEAASPWFAERLLHTLARDNDTDLTALEQPKRDLQLGLW